MQIYKSISNRLAYNLRKRARAQSRSASLQGTVLRGQPLHSTPHPAATREHRRPRPLWRSSISSSSHIHPKKRAIFRHKFKNDSLISVWYVGFPGGASGKEPACQCRRRKRCFPEPPRKLNQPQKWLLSTGRPQAGVLQGFTLTALLSSC